MWKPDESLADYMAKPVEVNSEAPSSVSLRRTGEVEVLTPLTRVEARAKRGRYTFKAPYQPLWFRRFLAVGSGVLVMTAFVLVSAILIEINDPSVGPDVAANGKPELTQPEELSSRDVTSLAYATGRVDIVRSNPRRRQARASTIYLIASKPRLQLRPPLQPEEPNFVPTTLVIYAKNGVINTRIEPWFQDGDKKTTTFNN